MKILVDLQACQSLPHRGRGIGRYALSLADAMCRLRGERELSFALNAAIPGTIEAVRATLPPCADFFVFHGLKETAKSHHGNRLRRIAGGVVRDAAFTNRVADVHHISSFFEGYDDDVMVDVARMRRVPATATLYDLIPLLYQDIYLQDDRLKSWYLARVDALKRVDSLLAISECTRRDAIEYLGFDPSRVVNISAAADPMFRQSRIAPDHEGALRARYGLWGRILLYTGGIDHRKNIGRLIEAFSNLDPGTRDGVQLVIVCAVDDRSRQRLLSEAASLGLPLGQLVLTGYVKDEDLVAFYNICEAFVFPSWYEGFGLPVLEAMACGAAVIASNRASVPEVLGRNDALFDPDLVDDMEVRIAEVLTNRGFRDSLREHGLTQAKRFSWENSASHAMQAIEEVARRAKPRAATVVNEGPARKTLLAYVSPVPPEQTGIAYYSSELLPHLAQHYRIVLITDQQEVATSAGWPDFETHDSAWFEGNAGGFDRILYNFGNSAFHWRMFDLIERFGGVAVLHDFYLSGVVSHLQWASKIPGFWNEYLYRSHGYRALIELASGVDQEEMLLRYPCNAPVIENADGIIVHSRHACQLAKDYYGEETHADWFVIPQLRAMQDPQQSDRLRMDLGIPSEDFIVCSFGILGDGKLNHKLINAWRMSALAREKNCRLVLVGEAHDPAYRATLRNMIDNCENPGNITITGHVTSEEYDQYLQVADVAVQLRSNSRGETSRALLDCLANGVPTIVNAHGSMAEIDPQVVVMLLDEFDDAALVTSLERLWDSPRERERLAGSGADYCRRYLDPKIIAEQFRSAVETAYSASPIESVREAGVLMGDAWEGVGEGDRRAIAETMAANLPARIGIKTILIDVTELTKRDAKSGIQRVVRSIVSWLLRSPPDGYRVEPVYADVGQGYRYARKFCCDFLGLEPLSLADELVVVQEGDVFIGLDLALEEIPANTTVLQAMRDLGANVYVVAYDVLPLMRNDCFPSHAEQLYRRWLASIAAVATGIICISRSVADEVLRELDGLHVERLRPLQIGYFHLGADIEESLPSSGMTRAEQAMVDGLRGVSSFLMVGTVEPRKGHAQSLDAFELLWRKGSHDHLVIAGKPGWMTEQLVERIRGHTELGRRLLWFESATDEALDALYGRCSALLSVSEGEGFGLPLIEAARHELPIIARNLPVFREVAAAGAYYFDGYEPRDIASAVERWNELDVRAEAPCSSGIRWITWRESAKMLVDAATGKKIYAEWRPSSKRYVPMYDSRHELQSGERNRSTIVLPTRAGVVVRTHPIAISQGAYRARLLGFLHGAGVLKVDVSGQEVLLPVSADGQVASTERIYECEQFLEFSADEQDARITIHSDGNVKGSISALLFEPAKSPGKDCPSVPQGNPWRDSPCTI